MRCLTATGTRQSLGTWVVLIVLAWAALWSVRLAGPPNFVDADHQERQAAYILDVLVNHHWIHQESQIGELAGKPPLYTWLSALAAKAAGGRLTPFTLCLPGALATLGVALMLWSWGRRYFGVWPGLLAALAFLFSPAAVRMVNLARTDGLFTCAVLGVALLGFSAWQRGRGWVWFWLAAAAATLTKGPLGLLLGSLGFLAVFWRDATPPPAAPNVPPRKSRIAREQLAGAALFLLLCCSWFLLAWHAWGRPFIDRVIFGELLEHAVGSEAGGAALMKVKPSLAVLAGYYLQPAGYLFARFLPWSLIGLAGVIRVFRKPAADPTARRFERFLVCMLLAGLAIFTLASHRRPDLLFPLMPALALLAGRELAAWWRPETRRHALVAPAAAGAAILLLVLALEHRPAEQQDRNVVRTRGATLIHQQLAALYGPERPPLLYTLDAAVGLQFLEGTFQRHQPPSDLARRLAAPEPVLVAAGPAGAKKLKAALPPGAPLYEIVPWPFPRGSVPAFLTIYGNRPAPRHSP